MKKDPPAEKGTSATVAVRITINGQVFEMTKAEAEKLRDQLNAAVGEKASSFPHYPPGVRGLRDILQYGPAPTPGYDKFYRTPSAPTIPNPYEITCDARAFQAFQDQTCYSTTDS